MNPVNIFYHYDDRIIAKCLKVVSDLFGISATIKDVTSIFDLPTEAVPWVILLSPSWRAQQLRIWLEKLNYLVDDHKFYDVRLLLNGHCHNCLGEYLIGCGAKTYQYGKVLAILANSFHPTFEPKAVEQTERIGEQIESFIRHKHFGGIEKTIQNLDKIVPWLASHFKEK
jgi:hypothetical protein